MTVDLTITGDRPATISGTKGECSKKVAGDGPPIGEYVFSGSDYPSLGAEGAFSLSPAEPYLSGGESDPYIKVVIGDVGFLSSDAAGITVSADGKQVTLDNAISGGSGGTLYVGKVTGTIVCA